MYRKQPKRREVITFRHFSRKGCALFAVLGREVRIGVLSAATLAAAAPCMAQGAEKASRRPVAAATDTTLLGEAEVTAERAVSKVTEASAVQMQVLTRTDLARAGVNTVNDALKLAIGVDVRQRGSFAMQTDISIDGGTFDQIAILVNGFPVTNPQTGHHSADIPLNISDIERVEVIEGPGSTLYGAQAFGGAVNIVTRTQLSSPAGVEAAMAAGSYGTVTAEARGAVRGGGFTSSLSGSFSRSDGAVDNSDFRGGRLFWQGICDTRAFGLSAQVAASLNDFGANTFYSAAYPDQWEATRRYQVAVRGSSKGRVQLLPEVSWTRNVDHFQLVRHMPAGENFHRTDVYTAGMRLYAELQTGMVRHRLTLGGELKHDEIYSTNLGLPLDAARQFHVAGCDTIFYTHRDARLNAAFTLSDELTWRGWALAVRLLAQRNTAAARTFRLYPGVNLRYAAGRWTLYASWNKALRLPTFTDLYYKSPTQAGNVGLRPEENSAFRLGASYSSRAVKADAKAFYSRGRHMIDWVMFAPDDIYHATSFGLDNMGVSVSAAVDCAAWLGTRQPLRRLTLSYAYIHQHRRAGEPFYKSNYALEYLRHKFVATLDHRICGALGASWSLRLQTREGHYIAYAAGTPTGTLRPYGTHAVVDLKLHWTQAHYSLFVDMQNLTDTRYFDLANVAQPGFVCLAGARVNF